MNNTLSSARLAFQLDLRSGVPVYRQLIDQVLGAIASGTLHSGDQLPTVRQAAVDLEINPNTVIRAYRELEIRAVLTTHQGSGTFVSHEKVEPSAAERQRQLSQLVGDFVARAGAGGFTVREMIDRLEELLVEQGKGVKRNADSASRK